MRPNAPPWVSAPLLRAGPAIERALGEGLLPIASSYYPAGPDVLGRGGFGYVLQTRTPGVVMKVTVDGSEAFLAEALRKLSGSWPGLPQYVAEALRVDLPEVYETEPVWIVWRKDTPPPTLEGVAKEAVEKVRSRFDIDELNFEPDRVKRRAARERYREEMRQAGGPEIEDVRALQQCGMTVISLFSTVHSHGGSMADAFRMLRGTAAWARRAFDPSFQDHWGWSFCRQRDVGLAGEASVALLGYEMLLGRLAIGCLMPELAKSLLRLLEAGVIVGDVQADNVSAAQRPATLFDGGFTVPIDAKWSVLWDKTDVRVARWFDHGARHRPWEMWLR